MEGLPKDPKIAGLHLNYKSRERFLRRICEERGRNAMNKSPGRRWAVLLPILGLITSQASFAQCENPVSEEDVRDELEIGFSVAPGGPVSDFVLAAQGIPTRGFISPEAHYYTESDVVTTVQCETDYFLTYLWIGAGNRTPEDTAGDRIASLWNFYGDHSPIEFLIDGVLIDAPIEVTEPQDGFNPWAPGTPMAYMFVYWISAPFGEPDRYSLEPDLYEMILHYSIDRPSFPDPLSSTVDLEVLDVPKLVAADGSNNNFFGWSSAISGDTAVIGAYKQRNENGRSGAAYVFDRNTAGAVCPETGTQDPWCEQAKLVAFDGADGDRFGYRVAISGDTIIVSARRDDTAGGGEDAGSAYVFTRAVDVWTQQAKLVATDGAAFDTFGGGLAFAGDTALIGAPGDDNGAGSVYVFTGSGAAWTQGQKLTPDESQTNSSFGGSISISGDTALFGAGYDDEVELNAGAAYVFTRSAGVWTKQAKLTASDSVAWDRIGIHVALSAHTAILGANYANKAYVFVRDGVTWTPQAKLTVSDLDAGDFFGSVALFGDTAVIGADGDDDWAFDSGAAYVFTRSLGEWTEGVKLGAPDAAEREWFGKEVTLSGDIALITAPTSAISWNSTPGSAYAFDDMDGDGIAHDADNAPGFYNPFQIDGDLDGIGDVADTDFDGDLDGITAGVDTERGIFSAGFSDGTTWGTITARGGQFLTITDEPSPDGVRIIASASGGLNDATISVCGGTASLMLNAEDDVVVSCGSVSISVLIGPLEALIELNGVDATLTIPPEIAVEFTPITGTVAVTAEPSGPNSEPPPPVIMETTINNEPATLTVPPEIAVTIAPDTGTLTVEATDSEPGSDPPPVILEVGGAVVPIEPGETFTLVPFHSFSADVELRDDKLEIIGGFTLGSESDGIDPLAEDVTIKVTDLVLAIPAGSLNLDKKGSLKFEGVIDGAVLEVKIEALWDRTFGLSIEIETEFGEVVNPVEARLTIGDDAGTVSVIAELD